MIVSTLRLNSLGHCFVQLPKLFPVRIDVGSIITIRSVQDDNKTLKVIWDGTYTEDDETIVDKYFANINGFTQEPIVIDTTLIEKRPCTSCQVQLIDPNEYGIIDEHFMLNILDRCRLVYKDLKIPIWISDHVKVKVNVVHVEPIGGPVELTQWTEMQIENIPVKNDDTQQIPTKFVPSPSHIRVNLLITGSRGSGKTFQLKELAKKHDTKIINCKQLRGKRLESIKKIFEDQQSILFLDDIDSIVGIEENSIHQQRLVDWFCGLFKQFERSSEKFHSIICTCQSYDRLDQRISEPSGKRYFTYILKIEEPNLYERSSILKHFIDKHKANVNLRSEDLDNISASCKTFSPMDLSQLVDRAMISACSRTLSCFDSDPVTMELSDLEQALVGYTPINMRNVNLKSKSLKTFEQIGGLKSIKADLLKLILMPLKYPKLYSRSPIKPQTSVLLYGPPGCGKTLIADALTNQADINSICIRGPELLSKYIGSSEAAVRDLFKKAQLARPCIIFFDEFESLVAKRGSDSTGVTDRVVNQFLTLMDGFEELSHDVFIIAATSRPDMIDPAILRPGRIDKHLYCAYPDYEDRLDILKVITSKMTIKTDDKFMAGLAKRLEHFTGADIQSLMYSAQIKALYATIGTSDGATTDNEQDKCLKLRGNHQDEIAITIEEKHVLGALNEMLVSDDVESKHKLIVSRHPRNFHELANGIVSSRATLI